MELEFTPDQDELRDSIRTVLTKESPISLARAVVEDGVSTAPLWNTFAELGWPALTVPEGVGGIGLGAVEAGILAEELGRVVTPGPLLPTVTQFVPVARAFGADEVLAAVAAGEARATVAIAEATGSYALRDVATTARRDGSEIVLRGNKRFVMAGNDVDLVAVIARDGDALGAVIIPADALTVTPMTTLDSTRALVDVQFDDVRVSASSAFGFAAGSADALEAALGEATVAIALEMVGTAQTIFDVTLDYAKQREQFGVPIGSFQAVKHAFADMAVALERARATAYFAALTLAEADARWPRAVSVAKVAAGDCQRLLAQKGIQLHGGIGYTWEHDMHLYVRRMKTGEALFGTSAWHRNRIAELLGV
jgi:alkylation response protein AidB-like acyl-CoA dehydrogenase